MKAAYQVDGIYINRIDTATQKQIPFFAFSLVDISTEWRRVGVWYVILASLHNGFIQAIYPALDYQVTIGTVEAVNSKEEKKVGFFKRVIEKPGESGKKEKKGINLIKSITILLPCYACKIQRQHKGFQKSFP